MISILAALDQQNGIGKDNNLLCRLRDDMRNFKELTTGNVVVMGRKTYESLPKGALTNRENIVITRNTTFKAQGCTIMNTIDEVINHSHRTNKEVFVIGGGEVYELLLPYASKLYLSFIEHRFDADTFFPQIDYDNWSVIENKKFEQSDRNDYSFVYKVMVRK